jgi:hypothetical protein
MTESPTPGFYSLITRITPEEEIYDQAIGRFIQQFSEAEVALMYVAVEYAKISPFVVGIAALSPIRVDGGINTIKKIIEVRKLRGKSARELLHVLDHFSVINKARNDLLHYGVGVG